MSDLLANSSATGTRCWCSLIAGFLPNEVWRMIGLWLGGGVDEGSELLVWVRAVATAILAGVIAQILLQPPGALASVPDWLRYAAVAAGFVGLPRDAPLDLCRRRLRRTPDAGRQMVARLIGPSSDGFSELRPSPFRSRQNAHRGTA